MEPEACTTRKQRVLVVEDDPRMLELVCKGLREVGHTPMPAANGNEGLDLATHFDFDSVILDIGLPGRDGYALIHAIRENKKVPILMLTARDTEQDILRAFELGADDYLTKPFYFRELLARLQVLGRSSRQQPTATFVMDPVRLTLYRAGVEIPLTRSEFLLLAALHADAGTAVPRKVLTEAVWGVQQLVSANGLDVLVNALRRKVDGTEMVKTICTVRGIGYRLQLEGSPDLTADSAAEA